MPLAVAVAAPPRKGAAAPVAIVLGHEIRRADLAPPGGPRPDADAEWKAKSDALRLQGLLLAPLLMRYAQQKQLEPTPQEVRDCTAAMDAKSAELRERQKQELDTLRRQLGARDLSVADREDLRTRLMTLENVTRFDEADQAERAQNPELAAESSARVSRDMVLAWKVQRELHRQYGGDIIFQQAGPEAVGAYPLFLEERQKAGDFQILDPDLSRRFWERIRKGAGIRVEQDALETPWWLEKPAPKR
ncbi:hypothetical protein LZ198_10655 [Myxococcus sp. K15C18031901]|uniref:hypothetical protein n=1 Tax=Myxococcus dinghuensis TaxID=2906761 RepID=UPI0020A805FD|nr:hypothetical protein [Myxococcus dinghuensis]MCP3099330.1 hypothetical protein [Myxococcus dinghuensis]